MSKIYQQKLAEQNPIIISIFELYVFKFKNLKKKK